MKLSRDLTCAEVVELVTEYLEGGLTAGERDRFEQHIGSCDGCRTYLDQMRQTIRLTGRLREDDLSPHVQEVLLETFRRWKAD
jgi:predicted anti-sigma-YlaC factor YlaD